MKFHGLDQFQEWLVIDILLAIQGEEDVKMKIEKLKPGMVVFSVGKMRMGNTAIKTVVVHPVLGIEAIRGILQPSP